MELAAHEHLKIIVSSGFRCNFYSDLCSKFVTGMTATLRGRPLHGQVMNVPSGYTGRVFWFP